MLDLNPLAIGTVACIILAAISLIAMAIARSVVKSRNAEPAEGPREQDIVAWGTLIMWAFLLAAVVFGVACIVVQWVATGY